MFTFDPLVDALKKPLPETADKVEQLREMVAYAESWGIIVSEERRRLLAKLEIDRARSLDALRAGVGHDDDGQLTKTQELADRYLKLNADEKKIMLEAEVATVAADLDFVTNLENLIKRRCSLGQSISNSFNIEKQSSYNH